MHGKKIYINKSMYSIQGLKTVSNSLPKGLKKIFKKGISYNLTANYFNKTNIFNMCLSKNTCLNDL